MYVSVASTGCNLRGVTGSVIDNDEVALTLNRKIACSNPGSCCDISAFRQWREKKRINREEEEEEEEEEEA